MSNGAHAGSSGRTHRDSCAAGSRARPWVAAACAGLVLAGSVLGGCAARENRLTNARYQGDMAMREARYGDAAAWYEKYLGERPAKPEVMYDLAMAYQGMGEPSAAREALSVAYELAPDDPKYIEALARAMAANGEIPAALDLLEQIAVDSLRGDAYLRLGEFLLEQGFADESVQAMRTAAALNPSAGPWVALARAYETFGDGTRELEALRHAAWYAPQDPAIAERVRALGAVPGPTFAREPRN